MFRKGERPDITKGSRITSGPCTAGTFLHRDDGNALFVAKAAPVTRTAPNKPGALSKPIATKHLNLALAIKSLKLAAMQR
ncbi:hypothetical protein [Aquibium oceanicum]|uniref:Uncharacterized protein n=1 Tax=Aquibium oceanicum TaxID=1670800 RepID=A0A1L3SP02_9HYPH|nr:hypothetical protein [Aquibium oceanicum]APH71134.1 hypothetical protein BSQ44_06940 [Aquibium oceanicum]